MDNYTVTNIKVGNLLSDAQVGNIAIPEIQRPFVWKRTKVRDLIDSLYKNYPVKSIILCKILYNVSIVSYLLKFIYFLVELIHSSCRSIRTAPINRLAEA